MRTAAILTGCALLLAAGCNSIPKPKSVNGRHRQPINPTHMLGTTAPMPTDKQALELEIARLRNEVERLQDEVALAWIKQQQAREQGLPMPTKSAEPPALAPVDVRFEFGKTEFQPSGEQAAILIASAKSAEHVDIRGYTDDRGTQAVNELVALRRALAAKSFLMRNGIEETKMTATSAAGTYTATNDTAEGRAANRRVSFEFKADKW